MWARYVYAAGATVENIAADLAAIVGGAAVASLSASCVKASTEIYGEPSPWSVLSLAYGVVCADGEDGVKKYLRFGVPAVGKVRLAALESWDSSSPSASSAGAGKDVTPVTTSSGVVMVYVSSGSVAIVLGIGGVSFAVAFEIRRGTPATAGGRPAVGVLGGVNYYDAISVRLKNQLIAGDLVKGVLTMMAPQGATVAASRDEGEAIYAPILPVSVCQAAVFVGVALGLFRVGDAIGVTGDVLVCMDGAVYVVLRTGAGAFAIRRE